MYIKVTVVAGARVESLEEVGEARFKISVKEKAERNMANTRVIELVASHFGVPTSKIRIINGHQHPSKLISIQE